MTRVMITMVAGFMSMLFAVLQQVLELKPQTSMNSYGGGVGIIRTLVMMAGLRVIVTRLRMIMVRLLVALKRRVRIQIQMPVNNSYRG